MFEDLWYGESGLVLASHENRCFEIFVLTMFLNNFRFMRNRWKDYDVGKAKYTYTFNTHSVKNKNMTKR